MLRVMMLGGSAVGKTSIVSRFLYNDFSAKHRRTIEEMHRGDFELENDIFIIDLLDTTGSYDFPAMRDLNIRNSDAFVLVYSIDSMESYDLVMQLREEIISKRDTAPPIVIAANKSDATREVPYYESDCFVEVSAMKDEGIFDLFTAVVKQAKLHVNLEPAARRRRDSFSVAKLVSRRRSVVPILGKKKSISSGSSKQLDASAVKDVSSSEQALAEVPAACQAVTAVEARRRMSLCSADERRGSFPQELKKRLFNFSFKRHHHHHDSSAHGGGGAHSSSKDLILRDNISVS